MTAGPGPTHHAHVPETDTASLIEALRSRAEEIRRAEMVRADGHWESLSDDDRRRIDALTRSIVSALLDEPTARLRAGAARGGGSLQSARYLFGMEA